MRYAFATVFLVGMLGWRSDSVAQEFVDVVVPYAVPPGGKAVVDVVCLPTYYPLCPVFPNPDPEDVEITEIGHTGIQGGKPGGIAAVIVNRDIFTRRGTLMIARGFVSEGYGPTASCSARCRSAVSR